MTLVKTLVQSQIALVLYQETKCPDTMFWSPGSIMFFTRMEIVKLLTTLHVSLTYSMCSENR